MFRWYLLLLNLCIVSTLRIGTISQSIYVPDPANISPSLIFQFSSSCNECLCYIIDSTRNYSIINCLHDGRLCSYYTNFSSIYTFLENNNASVYLFQSPPVPSTPTQMLSTILSTTTSIVASAKTVLTTLQTTEMPIAAGLITQPPKTTVQTTEMPTATLPTTKVPITTLPTTKTMVTSFASTSKLFS